MSIVNILATVANKPIPIDGFDIVGGCYGSVGHAHLYTSRSVLQTLGIDLISIAGSAPGTTEVDVKIKFDNGPLQQIFGGEYVSANWNYDEDVAEIHARDWAGPMVDQKLILTATAEEIAKVLTPLQPGQNPSSKGVMTQNQSISQIVQQIATNFGLTYVGNLSKGNDPQYGTIYGDGGTVQFMSIPQSVWAMLNQFARDTGYEVYVTPTKQLVFGNPGAGLTPLVLSYNVNPVAEGAIQCKGLMVEHNPRRNSSFRVIVISYDPAKAQTVSGEATAIGTNLSGTGNPPLQPGVYSGGSAVTSINSTLVAGGARIPLYTFHLDGLTQAQAQTKATAIANNIAKREMILQATFDGMMVTPTQQVNMTGTVDSAVIGNNFYINSINHKFRMPKGHDKSSGYLTTIKGLDIAVQGNISNLNRNSTP